MVSTVHHPLIGEKKMNKFNEPDDIQDEVLLQRNLEGKRLEGKIFHLNKDTETGGYGFIASSDIPFERIYFFWTYLEQDTYKFMDLEIDTPVEFNAKLTNRGWRAIKIRVIEETKGEHHAQEPNERRNS